MAHDNLDRLTAALADRYRIERQVGQGGMATVFLAEDRKHHRRVAIKVLRPELSAALGTERFLREIELAAKLQHPHIVPVYDSGSADGVLYYVMPFVEGESLRDLMQREGRIPLDRAAEIVREAASGLEYAHQQGVVHRDVKPENIMLSAGHAVVADFGIARAIDASRASEGHLTGAGMAIGTPAYMSPEQATADTVDARSDQYALACVFYEMVTGKQAFSGPTMQAMLTSMLTGPRPRLSSVVEGIPPEVDGATQRALATDPKERFPTVSGFAQAVARETSGVAAASRESRRWKRLALVLPVLVGGLAVGWALLFGPGRRMVVSGAETIAVVPFTVSGSGLEGIGEGMVDLMASNLDGVGPIRTIEPRTVIREWRRRTDNQPGDLDDAIAVARSTNAASVLTGSIVATGGTARLTAELFDLEGTRLGSAQVNGPSDSVLMLADGLALSLLREIWKSREPLPSANASSITSASMPAIRAYLRGERYHRRGEWDSAQVAFEESVAADSTFALAWYRLANTLGWKGLYQNPVALTASANAVRFSDSLPPRTRSLLVAYDLFSRGQLAAVDSARSYLQRYPSDADGWYLLGEAQYHGRATRPLPANVLREPFDRVLALDSSLAPAAIHPMELAVAAGDTALLRRYETVFRSAGSTSEMSRATEARSALTGNDSSLVALFNTPASAGLALAAIHGLLASEEVDPDALLRTMGAVAAGVTNPQFGFQLRAMPGLMAQAFGRTDTARALLRELQASGQGGDVMLYVQAMPIFAGYADSALLDRVGTMLAQNREPPNQFSTTWRALVALDQGRPTQAQALLRPLLANPDTLQRFIHGAMLGIDGLAIVALGDTTRGMAVVDSALKMIGGIAATGFTVPVQLRYAMLLAARPQSRQQGITRLRDGFSNSPEIYPILQYYLGRSYESAGMADSAAGRYGQFLRLWERADSSYRPLTDAARAGLQRVTGEGSATAPAVEATP